ncbi:MAG: hypothetical protein EXR71_21125 [Myxococcales bacterium]|nr:hypothetical protein [Myxococcales bacterium]
MELSAGTAIDRYLVEARLGEGGMAVVYRVRHASLGSLHALKVLSGSMASVRERLMQEGRLQASLRHPNVVTVTDVVDVNGSPGLIMEFVDGPNLGELLDRGRLSLAQADALALGILEGVSAAHGVGLIHRDLKPANVLIASTKAGLVPKVADFGLAKLLAGDASGAMRKTRSGTAMGTPSYMAPEQIRNAKGVDGRADIFSLGAILYELYCGDMAFPGDDMWTIFGSITSGVYAHPQDLAPDIPERVAQAIRGALAVGVEDRISDCDALIKVLRGRQPAPRVSAGQMTWMPERHETRAGSDRGREQAPQSLTGSLDPVPPPRIGAAPNRSAPLGAASLPVAPAESGFAPTLAPDGMVEAPRTASSGPSVPAKLESSLPPRPSLPAQREYSLAPKGTAGCSLGVLLVAALGSGGILVVGFAALSWANRAVDEQPADTLQALAVGNLWVPIEPPVAALTLGLPTDPGDGDVLGFRPGLHVAAPQTAYSIQAHEVTWGELEDWWTAHPEARFEPPNWASPEGTSGPSARADLPACGVPWTSASIYCAGLGGRLPTESEWEYAARGPTLQPYPWGLSPAPPQLRAMAGEGAVPVAVKTSGDVTSSGVYDMIGNVQEWTMDRWSTDDPAVSDAWSRKGNNVFRSIRGLPLADAGTLPAIGAAWRDRLCAAGDCLVKTQTSSTFQRVGFRCVK